MKQRISIIFASIFFLFSDYTFTQTTVSATTSASEKPQSEWVYPGRDGKLIYKTTPAGDKIMDFSYAGYMGGGVALPNLPVTIAVQSSGGEDKTDAIQAAIDKVAAMPLVNGHRGTILLEAGIFTCSKTITIATSGVVLRGSGSGENGTMIKMTGSRHTAIVIGGGRGRNVNTSQADGISDTIQTKIIDTYVPSGASAFTIADAIGFEVGNTIVLRRPVTEAWIKFMQMDNLKRDGRPQTWIRTGTYTTTERRITAISNNTITLDVPLTDSFDSQYLNPPGTSIMKIAPPTMVEQVGIEYIHIQAPPMEMSYQQAPYTAVRMVGRDCWARDIKIDETMNSISIGGSRLTLERVAIDRTVPNLGASKPAEFAPNASQILLDRCSSNGNNIWHIATGAGQAGPIVILNCTFGGSGHIEGHQRWTTGMLLDNCKLTEGGIDLKNRGAMGSGHGWGVGWSVAWNCIAKTFVVQQPPGAFNWMIGCIGPNVPTPRPFDSSPDIPLGISDSPDKPVVLKSLYLAQLAERLGPQGLKNIGYSPDQSEIDMNRYLPQPHQSNRDIDNNLGKDVAAHKLANASNVRHGDPAFGGERALDDDPNSYWSTDDGVTHASLEVDLEVPQVINRVELQEAKNLGQRVQEYKVEGQINSDWKLLAHGTTIGDCKVDQFLPVLAWKVRLSILKSNASPAISKFGVYLDNITPSNK